MRTVQHPTGTDLDRARVAVKQHLSPTPLTNVGPQRWLKLECDQPIGAFKIRGAIAALSRFPKGTQIITASAGNHAIGVAWAADKLGQRATIVVAETASPRKIEILREMGANVVLHGSCFEEAEAYAISRSATDGLYISAYNDPHVIAGQATVLDELLEELAGDFTVIVPVGGGGLIAGIALRAAAIKDRTIGVIGVEAAASRGVSASVSAGHTVEVAIGETIADGLAGNVEPGSITVDILRAHLPIFTTVTEEQIRNATRALYRDHDLVAEGAAATSFAIMQQMELNRPLVAIITGRNISDEVLQSIID